MENFHDNGSCPVRSVLSRLGDKWSVLVFSTLHTNGTMRFGEIHRTIGDISHRMLTVTLRTLEEDGLVSRQVYPEVPPKVEYRLTPTGESLMPHLNALVDWAVNNMEGIRGARETSCGSSCCLGKAD